MLLLIPLGPGGPTPTAQLGSVAWSPEIDDLLPDRWKPPEAHD